VLCPCCMLPRTCGDPHARSSSRPLQDLENSGLTSIVEPVTKPNLSRRMWRCIDCLGLLCVGQRAPRPPRHGFVGRIFALATRMWIVAQEACETGCASSAVAPRIAFPWARVALGTGAFGFQLVNIAVLLIGRRRFPGSSLGRSHVGGIFLCFFSIRIGGRLRPVFSGRAHPVDGGHR
jgi:hypothetical protein